MSLRASVAVLALAALSPAANAHHSFAAEFSYNETGTISGTVVEVLYVNPHARFFIAVKDESGKDILWDAQTRSPNALSAVGWSKDTVHVGEQLTIEGNFGRDKKHKIWIREIRRTSGEVIRPTGEEPPP